MNTNKFLIPVLVFFTSFFLIITELLTTRIFSLLMWYHFAFVAISIALIGLGAAGMYIYLFVKLAEDNIMKLLKRNMLFTGLSLLIAYLFIFNLRIMIRSNLLDVLKIGFVYFLLIIPFFFGGQVLIIIYRFFSKNISKLYFFDLLGASLGCLFFILFIEVIIPPKLIIIISFAFFILSTIIIDFEFKYLVIALLVIAVPVLFFINSKYSFFDIKYIKGTVQTDVILEDWNAISRVAVYPPRFVDWGINQNIKFDFIPDLLTMDIDATAGMQIIRFEDDKEKLYFLSKSITSIPFHISNKPKTLVIGAGGGKDVLVAHYFGSEHIDAVDINPSIEKIINHTLGDFTGRLYKRSDLGIYFHLRDGRSFVRETRNKYDIIQLSLVDTWAASSSGALTLSENTLYTVEAFEDYIKKLDDGGFISITRFLFEPPRESLRTVSVFLEAAKRQGIENPEKSIFIATSDFYPNRRVATFIFKNEPFTDEELNGLIETTNELGFSVHFAPSKNLNNTFYDFIYSDNLEEFYEDFVYNVRPVTDNNPFFFYMLKFNNIFDKSLHRGIESVNLKALYLLFLTIIIISFFTFLFVILPLFFKVSVSQFLNYSTFPYVLYFISIGMGFMLVEIFFIQKFILYLGHPIYSLSVVISGILLFTGIGSYLTNKVENNHNTITKTLLINFAILFVIFIIYNFGLLDSVIYSTLASNQIVKYIIAYIFIAPLGFLLGKFFPLCIKLIPENNIDYIQWMWSLNGSSSVLGSLSAYLIAMNFGFNNVMLTGFFFYIIACLQILIIKFKKPELTN